MKFKSIIFAASAALALTACASYQHEAKISRQAAETTALQQVPNGQIKEAELEKEKGKLVWSFDIAKPGTKDITEVQVDAMSGAVVSTEVETPEKQEKEKKEKD